MLKQWLSDKSITELVAYTLAFTLLIGGGGYLAVNYIIILIKIFSSSGGWLATLLFIFFTIIVLGLIFPGVAIVASAISWFFLSIGAIVETMVYLIRWCYRKICP